MSPKKTKKLAFVLNFFFVKFCPQVDIDPSKLSCNYLRGKNFVRKFKNDKSQWKVNVSKLTKLIDKIYVETCLAICFWYKVKINFIVMNGPA